MYLKYLIISLFLFITVNAQVNCGDGWVSFDETSEHKKCYKYVFFNVSNENAKKVCKFFYNGQLASFNLASPNPFDLDKLKTLIFDVLETGTMFRTNEQCHDVNKKSNDCLQNIKAPFICEKIFDHNHLVEKLRSKNIFAIPPKIFPFPEEFKFIRKENEAFQLRCLIKGYPNPVITWYKDDIIANSDVDNDTLKFTMLTADHIGTYKCAADNRVGDTVTHSFVLTVHYKPIINLNEEMRAEINDKVELSCVIRSNTVLRSHWFIKSTSWTGSKVDKKIEPDKKKFRTSFVQSDDEEYESRLIINQVTREDFIEYYCYTENEIGISKKMIVLKGAPPRKPKVYEIKTELFGTESVNVTFKIESYSPIDIHNFTLINEFEDVKVQKKLIAVTREISPISKIDKMQSGEIKMNLFLNKLNKFWVTACNRDGTSEAIKVEYQTKERAFYEQNLTHKPIELNDTY